MTTRNIPYKPFIIAATLILIIIGLSMALIRSTKPKTVVPTVTPTPKFRNITVTGKILCLPHKGNGAVQTMECAYGIQDRTGTFYGLKDSDPNYKNISGIAMNTTVTVKGVFTHEESDVYPTIGVIEVSSITK